MRRHLGPIEAAPTRLHDGGSEGAPIPRKQLSASSSGQSAIRGVKVGGVEAKCTRSSWPRRLAQSAPCGAACIEVAVEAAAHGCCVAQKRQRHGGRFVVLVLVAVIKSLLVFLCELHLVSLKSNLPCEFQ